MKKLNFKLFSNKTMIFDETTRKIETEMECMVFRPDISVFNENYYKQFLNHKKG